MAGIRLEAATKVYPNGVKALDAVTLDIEDGEFMVLVGPSGCGKSTFLRMIAGLEEVTEGRILIGERDVTRLRPRDRELSLHVPSADPPRFSIGRGPEIALQRPHFEVAPEIGLDALRCSDGP